MTSEEVVATLERLHGRYVAQVDVVLEKNRPDLARKLAAKYTEDALRVILACELPSPAVEEA